MKIPANQRGLERLTGKTRAQGEGQLNTDVFPGTADDGLTVFAEMADAGKAVALTRRTDLFSGWFELSAFPLDGQLFAASFMDATEKIAEGEARERAETDLQAANHLLANVVQKASGLRPSAARNGGPPMGLGGARASASCSAPNGRFIRVRGRSCFRGAYDRVLSAPSAIEPSA